MKTIDGNLLDQSPGILCHQVNLHCVMGAGLALQIKQRWPSVFDDYVRFCHKDARLGEVLFSPVNPELFVANLFGHGYRGCMTNYPSYAEIFPSVKSFAAKLELPIYIPYGLGCGIAGGDWNQMSVLIERHLPDAVIVRFQP